LTVFGRHLLVDRVELESWTIARAAEAAGVTRQTATKWVRRYRDEGLDGLEDRTSRPHHSPRALEPGVVEAILLARHELGVGPHRLSPLLGVPRSTIGDVLERHGLSRLADRDRPTGIPIRYVRERPGELLHMDVKKLGRIPDGGGRVAYAAVYPDERGTTCAAFLREAAARFARLGVRIERVMTDNAKNYTASRAFAQALDEIGARHLRTRPFRPQTNGKSERFNRTMLDEWAYARPYTSNNDRHLRTRPFRPQTNGKSERFNRTMLDEWAYARPYTSNNDRRLAFGPWLDRYNQERPHSALGGLTPMQALVNNVSGNHS